MHSSSQKGLIFWTNIFFFCSFTFWVWVFWGNSVSGSVFSVMMVCWAAVSIEVFTKTTSLVELLNSKWAILSCPSHIYIFFLKIAKPIINRHQDLFIFSSCFYALIDSIMLIMHPSNSGWTSSWRQGAWNKTKNLLWLFLQNFKWKKTCINIGY